MVDDRVGKKARLLHDLEMSGGYFQKKGTIVDIYAIVEHGRFISVQCADKRIPGGLWKKAATEPRSLEILDSDPEPKKPATPDLADPQVFATQMRAAFSDANPDSNHKEADDLMCALLGKLGYDDAVAIFREGEKWYE